MVGGFHEMPDGFDFELLLDNGWLIFILDNGLLD
jgi:hypothetical protein